MNELLTRMSLTLDALRTELYLAEGSDDPELVAAARAQYDETAARFRADVDAATDALLARLAAPRP
jgi:hypothetical protein